MYFATSCVFFVIFITLQSSAVESFELETRELTTVTVNGRISNRVVYEKPKYTTSSCGGILTQAPGKIYQYFDRIKPRNVQCTWTIKAPVGYSVYISKYSTTIRYVSGEEIEDLNDSVNLQIYEGHDVLSGKLLLNSKSELNLNQCISKGQTLTVALNYTESGMHDPKEINLEYGFVERSKISDLLN